MPKRAFPHKNQCSMNREDLLRARIMNKFLMRSPMMLGLLRSSSKGGSFL